MTAAAIVLALAAVGGLTMAVLRFQGAPRPPRWLALGHGAIAATGIILLIYAAATAGIPGMAQVALGIFVLAALGGTVLFVGFDLSGKALPIPFVVAHGLLAVTGLTLVLVSIFR